LIGQAVSMLHLTYLVGRVIAACYGAMVTGQVCSLINCVVSTLPLLYLAAELVRSLLPVGLRRSDMFPDWLGGIFAMPNISGSGAGRFIAATWAAIVRYIL